jgi:hypothetical protein
MRRVLPKTTHDTLWYRIIKRSSKVDKIVLFFLQNEAPDILLRLQLKKTIFKHK